MRHTIVLKVVAQFSINVVAYLVYNINYFIFELKFIVYALLPLISLCIMGSSSILFIGILIMKHTNN